jgi:polyhydroxybutyrate depolymerase
VHDRRVLAAVVRALVSLVLVITTAACYWVRAPEPSAPTLSAGVHAESIEVNGQARSYLLYVPKHLPERAPLVVLLHGSKQTGASFRMATGYAFDRLADAHGFVAVYPNGYRKHWNDCRSSGRYAARKLGMDDVGFVMSLIDRLQASTGVDPARVFLAGYSNGGQLAFRVATERPDRIAGLAAFSANLPASENWACAMTGKPVSALLVNGTADQINPFEGGEVTVFGFASRGRVRSSIESAHYFAELAGLSHLEQRRLGEASGEPIDEYRWRDPGKHEVMLLAVHGGGHVVPGPHAAFPGILGPAQALDGPAAAWSFFARQLQQN